MFAEPDEGNQYQASWESDPIPFQSNDPVCAPQIHGVGDDVYLDTETDGAGGLDTDTDNLQGDPITDLPGTSGSSGGPTFNGIVTNSDDDVRYNAVITGTIGAPV